MDRYSIFILFFYYLHHSNSLPFDKDEVEGKRLQSALATIYAINARFGIADDMIEGESNDEKHDENNEEKHHRERRVAAYTLLWPKKEDGNVYIPYHLPRDINPLTKSAVDYAIESIGRFTCIRFVPCKHERQFVNIRDNGKGCWAWMGRDVTKHQHNVMLSYPGCTRGYIATHELLHTIGLAHQMARHDRDQYITIHQENIKDDPQIRQYFAKHPPKVASVSGMPFTPYSLMMYGSYDFSKNGEKTITWNADPKVEFINRVFSWNDVNEINRLYQCEGYNMFSHEY